MDPEMQAMADPIHSDREAGWIMEYVAEEDRQKKFFTVKQNDPCPCGGGRKYKKCCSAPV